ERKVVTILFADVIGSTALGEQLDPERLRALLGVFFIAMSSIIESWGGTVEKYIGDAIMAVFGVPIVHEDDAERALRAALEMRDRLVELNADFERQHQVTLNVRVGVNTGEVVTPVGPTPEHGFVTGDAVNTAQRLEAAAEPGEILAGERTYAAALRAFLFKEPRALDLKGKSGPVHAYPLLEALAEAAPRGVRGLSSPMIGRDREHVTLTGLLEETIEGARPRLVVIYGSAGIGKSRLTAEFLASTRDASPETRVLRGRCLAAGHGITYWALGEILRGACQIGLDEPVDVVRERLQRGLAEILAPLALSPEDEQLTIAALATTVGIRLGRGSEAAEVGPASVEELARAWPRFATAYAQAGPAIWVIEDLHWAGEPAVEMIGQIARRTDGPLLIVATARPEFAEQHPAFGPGGQDAIAISLRPLTDNQSNDLVDRLLAVAELPDALRAEIVTKADGNPFYVEEILQRLIDEGALARDGERWKATKSIGAVVIPDSVQALLAARIDALLPEERRVLQEAAVVGRTFWAASLESTVDPAELASSLTGLERKGMVLVRPTSTLAGQTEYLFKHALVRDVAYATLPKARRGRAHAAVADWIASLAGDRSDEFAELIAYHYWAAVRGEGADLAWLDDPDASESVRQRAFASLLRAGRAARHRFAMHRAVELHEQALELATSDAERLDALEQIARDHEAAFHGDAAVATFVAALEIARKDPTARGRVAVLARHAAGMAAHRGGSFIHEFDSDMIEGLIEEGLAAATDQRERAWLLAAYGALIRTKRMMASTPQVPMQPRLDAVLEAGRIGEELDDPNLMVVAADVLSDLYEMEGDPKRAHAAFEPSIPVIDRIDRPAARAQWYHNASLKLMWLTAEPRRSEALATRAYEMGRRLSAHDQGHGTYSLMLTSFLLGDWDRVETLLAEHLLNPELARGVHCIAVESGPALGSLVIAHRGDPERAIEVARHSRGWEERSGAVEGQLAEALVMAGALEEGRALATDVLDRAQSWRWSDASRALIAAIVREGAWDQLPALLARISTVRESDRMVDALAERAEGMAFAAADEADRARESLFRALSALEGFEMVFEVALTKEALASVSHSPERERLLGEAIATYQSLQAAPHLARAEGLLHARPTGSAATGL
ncbi:MAG: adenylate/guanylate cyclase domain-containing protein, partial [Chloroflexota bacterium]